jgi:hypothetical protein
MSLYPNPTSGLFYVEVQSAEPQNKVTVDVFDILGRVVLSSTEAHFQSGETDLLMDGARLPSGLYLVRVSQGTLVKHHSLIITR